MGATRRVVRPPAARSDALIAAFLLAVLLIVVLCLLLLLLARALGYLVGAILVIPFVVSLALAVVGTTLVASARERGVDHTGLLRATLVASIPSALFVAYALYVLFASAL